MRHARRAFAAALLAAALHPVDAAAQTDSVLAYRELLGRRSGGAPIVLREPFRQVDLYFQGAGSDAARSGRLTLAVENRLIGFDDAFLELHVNGSARESVDLTTRADSFTLVVPLAPGDLLHEVVHVGVRYGGRLTDDLCFDARQNGSFLALLPGSAIELELDAAALEPADFWRLLPDRVRLGVRGPLDEARFAAAWQVGAALLRTGRRVEMLAVGEAPPVPSDSLGLVLLGAAGASGPGLALVQGQTGPTLVLGGQDPLAEARRITARSVPVPAAADAPPALSLGALGIATTTRSLFDRVEWTIPVSVRDLPPGRIPSGFEIDLRVGAGTVALATVAHVFFNEVLIHSQPGPSEGGTLRLSGEIPAPLLRVDNQLVVRLERARPDSGASPALTGVCRALPPPVPAELLPTSLLLTSAAGDVDRFPELPAELRRGFRAYLPAGFARDPFAVLPFLARLGADALPMADLRGVVFLEEGARFAPTEPFVLIGDRRGAELETQVAAEADTVALRDASGTTTLPLAGRTHAALLQIATSGRHVGLWVAPLDGVALPAPQALYLPAGDVALVGQQGVEVAHDSRALARERARYRRELVSQYRYLLYSVGILALGTLAVLALRLLRRRAPPAPESMPVRMEVTSGTPQRRRTDPDLPVPQRRRTDQDRATPQRRRTDVGRAAPATADAVEGVLPWRRRSTDLIPGH